MTNTQPLPLECPTPPEVLTGTAVLVEKTPGTTKGGLPYLSLRLRNRSGSAAAKVWSERVSHWTDIDVGRSVAVEAEVRPGWP